MEKDEDIDETNYRKYAKKAIKTYFDKHVLADALFWGHIVRLYEKDLTKVTESNGKR